MNIERLSNDQLHDMLQVAIQYMKEASETQPNSEWHEVCFAGVLTLANELNKRNTSKLH